MEHMSQGVQCTGGGGKIYVPAGGSIGDGCPWRHLYVPAGSSTGALGGSGLEYTCGPIGDGRPWKQWSRRIYMSKQVDL